MLRRVVTCNVSLERGKRTKPGVDLWSKNYGLALCKRVTWLKQAREMIVEHFPEALQLAQIAAAVGVHPVYLATSFREKFGITMGEFVRKLRIEHACDELIKGDLPLATIALQAGFVDQSHFSKVFKSYLGTTPAKYRRSFRRS